MCELLVQIRSKWGMSWLFQYSEDFYMSCVEFLTVVLNLNLPRV